MAGGQDTVCPKTDEILEVLHQYKKRSVNNYGWPLVQRKTQNCRVKLPDNDPTKLFLYYYLKGLDLSHLILTNQTVHRRHKRIYYHNQVHILTEYYPDSILMPFSYIYVHFLQ
jgi:hypothetical protein